MRTIGKYRLLSHLTMSKKVELCLFLPIVVCHKSKYLHRVALYGLGTVPLILIISSFLLFFLVSLILIIKAVGGIGLVDSCGALVKHWTLRCFAAVVSLYFEMFSHCDYS
jgi:hypothetical protein